MSKIIVFSIIYTLSICHYFLAINFDACIWPLIKNLIAMSFGYEKVWYLNWEFGIFHSNEGLRKRFETFSLETDRFWAYFGLFIQIGFPLWYRKRICYSSRDQRTTLIVGRITCILEFTVEYFGGYITAVRRPLIWWR